jgi:hypothetical protein
MAGRPLRPTKGLPSKVVRLVALLYQADRQPTPGSAPPGDPADTAPS